MEVDGVAGRAKESGRLYISIRITDHCWAFGVDWMIHYSCDRCKRELEPSELRYAVKLELQAVLEPAACADEEADRDYLCELNDQIECDDLEDFDDEFDAEEPVHQHHYDLCPRCAKEVRRNPLGRETHMRFGFSQN
jgi:DNA-directed RNA polymerase subunit RPC12/RpoP